MSNIVAHPGTQDQPDQASRPLVHGYERTLGIERSAARKTHNIVQKTQRPAQSAVLIVDLGIDVAAIGARNQSGSRLVILPPPSVEFRSRDQVPVTAGVPLNISGSTMNSRG